MFVTLKSITEKKYYYYINSLKYFAKETNANIARNIQFVSQHSVTNT